MLNLKWKHPEKAIEDPAAGSLRQDKMDAFVQKRCDKCRSEKITQLIIGMIALDLQQLSVVEDAGFNVLMTYVEPGYKVPCQKSITARVEKAHHECAAAIKVKLSSIPYVSLIMDT